MDFSFEPSIDLIIGPMFSGKTTELFRRLTIFLDATFSLIYINSILDTRNEDVASSHNSSLTLKLPGLTMLKIDSLMSVVESCKAYDIIVIDEGQFFPDLKAFCLVMSETCKKKVIVAGLNGDFQRNPFGQINDLIPVCDNITKLYPFCKKCIEKKILKHALFSKRTNTSNSDVILVGNKTEYIPVCRSCYIEC